MKSTLLILAILTSLSGQSQTFKLLPDSCTFCHSWYTLGGSTHYQRSYHVDPSVDTTVIGNSYTRVFYSGAAFYAGPQPFGIRQDANKLFGVVKDSLEEYLIMDFDALVGDTIKDLYSDGSFYDAIVTSKDSTWIEGINYHHWMELIGDSVHGSGLSGWIFRWQERTICNTVYPNGGIDFYPYGGVNFNLPWNYQLLGSAYVDVTYCSADAYFPDSFGYYCYGCQLTTNSLEELALGKVHLVRIVDVMGRETEFTPNTLLIYVYSDGTSEKVFKIE